MSKPRIVKDYEKLAPDVIEQLKLIYPRGYTKHLITFRNRDGEIKRGLPFETEDFYYLIRMTAEKASSIIEEDDDFDEDGNLKLSAKKSYEEKYDEDMLDLNSNDDNDFGDEMD